MWKPEDWQFCKVPGQIPPWNMDDVHVKALYEFVKYDKPQSVIEIGSYRGYSTSAFIQAINEGDDFQLHLIETKPTAELRQVIDSCKCTDQIVLHTDPSWITNLKADLVFIDGDHGQGALADVAVALAMNARMIVMHDSNSYYIGMQDCWGSAMGANILKNASYRVHVEDKKKRDGMSTDRGLLFSSGTPGALSCLVSVLA